MSLGQTKNRRNETRAVVEYENMDVQTLKKVGTLRGLFACSIVVCAVMVVLCAVFSGHMLPAFLVAVSGLVSVFTLVYRLRIESYYTRIECARGRLIEASPYTLDTEEKFYV
ncbi:MAG: hypothetical protein IJ309_02960 [Clostridia bacterium]|nr:hypothetical protein [Clostridia bacterium]